MDLCPRCGREFQMTHKFCGFCGFNLAASKTRELATQMALNATDMQLNLGKAYYESGKYEQALQAFEKLLIDNPGNSEAREMCKLSREALKASG